MFIFHVKSVIPSVTDQTILNIYIFMLLKDIFVALQPFFIFLVVFTILVTIAAPHLKFSTRVSPSIILTQQSF